MLAPYNNLATSVTAALVPTLFGPSKLKALEEGEPAKGPDTNPSLNSSKFSRSKRSLRWQRQYKKQPLFYTLWLSTVLRVLEIFSSTVYIYSISYRFLSRE